MSSKPLNYLTIGKTGQHELIIKKSKFICSLARTETVEEAQEFIEQVSKNIMMLHTILMLILLD